jgi:ABC-2 type transport system ATP-binding protein
MDEAEYCGRVGIMRAGKLLALDTPSALKENALNGVTWDVFAPEGALLAALEALLACPCVLRAGLAGDHLRAITPAETTAAELEANLHTHGINAVQLERVEPTLEDIFLALASR